MRALSIVTAALIVAACGPATDGSSEAGGSGTGSGPDGSSSGASTNAATASADSTSASTSGPTTSSSSASDTGELSELLPDESVITSGTCYEDGTMRVVIEGYFSEPFDSCMPPPDAPEDDILLVVIDPWNQFPGRFEVEADGIAQVTYGTESMSGTLVLDVWAPGHPSVLTLDVAGETTAFQGTLGLEMCTVVLDACMPPG